MKGLRTSEVARRAAVNLETIRFYERQGLLPAPPRAASGYRAFPAEAVSRVRFVKRAQDLGFSLREVKELLALRGDPASSCGDVRRRAEDKLIEIDRKIRDLRGMRKSLAQLVAGCPGRGATSGCPILVSLGGGGGGSSAAPGSKARDGRVMPSRVPVGTPRPRGKPR